MAFDEEIKLSSSGKATDGFQSVVIASSGPAPASCKYRHICVSVKNVDMPKCVAKIFMSGKKFEMSDSTKVT